MPHFKAVVVIPTRGGASKLHFPLEALQQQTEKNFQVIVVIDGDVDGSTAVVQRYIDSGRLSLAMIVFDENKGRVAALNAGYRAADAEILIRCDDDIEMKPDYIEKHLSFHKGTAEKGVMGLVHNIYPDTPHARAYGYYHDSKFREDAYKASADRLWNFWAANCSMRASTFKKVGGYDERYRRYGWEDVDMGKMLQDAGVQLILAPELEVNHHIAATTTASRARRALHSGASRQIFLAKHGIDALPPVNPAGVWGIAVKTVAIVLTETSVQKLGNLVDKISDRFPVKISEKLVALVVESASYAGIKYPARARKIF